MTQHQCSPKPATQDRAQHRGTGRIRSTIALLGAVTLALLVMAPAPAGAAPAAPTQAATGWFRLGHFAPAEDPVDLAVDGEVVVRDVAFRMVSDYLPVSAGSHQFRVTAAGASPDDEPLLELEAGVPADGAVTVAAVATRAGLGGQIYDDDLMTPPEGSALVRFIHASPDVAAVDIGVVDGPTLVTNVAYPTASRYVSVAAGTYDLRVTPADGGDDLIRVADWTAAAGAQRTVVLVRGLDGEPDVVPINDSDGTAAIPSGGLATGFGGLAEGPTRISGPSTLWLAAGAAALLALAVGLAFSAGARRPAWRPATILAFTGVIGLSAVSCAQPRPEASAGTTEPSPSPRAAAPTTLPTPSTVAPPVTESRADPDGPTVRSGANVNADETVGEPVSVAIPSIDVRSDLVQLGLEADGSAEVPEDPQLAGWFTGGPRPGDAGPAVIAGHVDTKSGPAVFARLDELVPGDEVEVTTSTGTVRFVADRTEQVPKDDFPTDRVYGPAPGDQLRLITCGGSFDGSIGHYRDNVVVYLSEIQS